MDLEIKEINEINRYKNLTRESVDVILSTIKDKASRKEGKVTTV